MWDPIGFALIPLSNSCETSHICNRLCDFSNGGVLASADVDLFVPVVVLKQVKTGIGYVVGVEEFSTRCARTPISNAVGARAHSFVITPDKGRQNVRSFGREFVVGPVKIGGHGRDPGQPILPPYRLSLQNTGDLCNGVGVVGRFEISSKQSVLLDGLGREFGINAGRTEKEHSLNIVGKRGIKHVGLDPHVVAEKINRVGAVSRDAPTLAAASTTYLGLVSAKYSKTVSRFFRSSSVDVRPTSRSNPTFSSRLQIAEPTSPRCPATWKVASQSNSVGVY